MGANRSYRTSRLVALAIALLSFSLVTQNAAAQVTVPSGFQYELFVSGLSSPTAMKFAPDGRLFVSEKGGALRVIKNGALLATPYLTVPVTTGSERGLLGIAFDPNFNSNRYIYVYYTYKTNSGDTAGVNRISRFQATSASADTAPSSSENVILDNIGVATAGNHNGGAIHFGADNMLYVAVGEHATRSNAPLLNTLKGKMLRLNTAAYPGSIIPSDNPYVTTSGALGEIWAIGLRNPFTFDIESGSGKIYINDVGEGTWEEINRGAAKANFGWPTCEGNCSTAGMTNPVYTYNHTGACAITGGAFYRAGQFPTSYAGSYLFVDYCAHWIKQLRTDNTAVTFASAPETSGQAELDDMVDVKFGPDGALYVVSISRGNIWRIRYIGSGNRNPIAQISANPTSGPAPLTVNFSAAGSSDPDGDALTYSWVYGDGTPNGSGQTSSHTYSSAASRTATVTVSDGRGGQASASTVINIGTPPVATITAPASGTNYNAGDTISYAGTGTDTQDGTLPASAFSWLIVFHHDTHTHPFLGPITGVKSGTFVIPQLGGHSETNVWYRINLTVTDSSGLTHTVSRDVTPRIVTLSLATSPAGLQLMFDDQAQNTPFSSPSVVGSIRNLGVVSPQTLGGVTYQFQSWSDGGAATHDVQTPTSNTSYTATFRNVAPSAPTGLRVVP